MNVVDRPKLQLVPSTTVRSTRSSLSSFFFMGRVVGCCGWLVITDKYIRQHTLWRILLHSHLCYWDYLAVSCLSDGRIFIYTMFQTWCLIITLENVDQFSKFFHQVICKEILSTSQRYPSHLHCVAALPCENRKSKKCYPIFMLNVKINVFN